MQTLRRTPLFERHAALGARLVPFAGWEMPVQYTSVGEEHRAVRTSAGVFDVSHMGQLRLAGEGARAYFQERLSNDLDRVGAGQAQYTLLTNEQGGIVDDLIVYRRGDDDYLLIVNAANVEADHAALAETADVSEEWALLAVQGPDALERIGVEIEPFTFREDLDVLGVRCLVAGTGYTGERGCELGCAPDEAPRLWDAIVGRGVTPCGLGSQGHAAARGLLSAAWKRHHARADADRGRARVGLRARQGVHRASTSSAGRRRRGRPRSSSRSSWKTRASRGRACGSRKGAR